jgi:hypothetical protein
MAATARTVAKLIKHPPRAEETEQERTHWRKEPRKEEE